MRSYFYTMSVSALRDMLDRLEERLHDLEWDDPDNDGRRVELENTICNLCELICAKEHAAA